MQQETPQPSQPAPQAPATPPTPPQPSTNQGGEEKPFYQPAAPAPFVGTAPAPGNLPAPAAAPVHGADQPHTISWEASEYIHNDKGGMWLVGLGAVSLVLASVAVYLQAWTFLLLIIVMAVTMGIFAFRKPHTVRYTLDDSGVHVGDRTFHYNDFRAFGVLQDGAFFTLVLIPLKRFSPSINVYFAEEQGETIIDIVGAHLPMEHIEPDFLDHLMRRLRF